MNTLTIRNVIFDVGNVIVRWSPSEITSLTFGSDKTDEGFTKAIFSSETWLNLNKGFLSEEQAKNEFKNELKISTEQTNKLFYYVKATQIEIFGTIELINKIKLSGYKVYALTDNTQGIVDYLKTTYNFWDEFDGSVVSADVGLLKPDSGIYQSLLSKYALLASESVFIDDMPLNVKGARTVGMSSIQFEDASQCEQALMALGLSLS
ncbi:HAD family hydrolase [Endozoicomonas arenosclerae]|uniref:HAD family hydrolase n=1 Tax=Endozoicomonas arenosclerae TaxID=1633495 RepID=UPI00078330DE|nr:HAD family phosphatase [Endozoicomonas arenosclerae]